MKCTKCGEDIKAGNLYCSKCGAEVQIVSAYNVMEEEFFLDIQNQEIGGGSKRGMADTGAGLMKKNFYISILIAIAGFFVLLVTAFLVRIHLQGTRTDVSQEHYTQMIQALSESDEEAAKTYLDLGISEQPEELTGSFWSAWLYGRQGNREKQIETLQHILTIDDENVYACRQLIRVYVESDDFESLHEFYNACAGSKLTVLFEDYLVEPPVIVISSEQVHAGEELSITAADGLNVYYTMDGSSPVTNGTLYYAPIRLEGGNYTLRAVACNEKGYYSEIVSQELTVEKQYQLGMPQVTPNSGEYPTPQTIYVNVPEGCSAYYTWNGSNPTTASRKYNGGISMPEGNNVLSVILVDAYGNVSSVQRVNYIYMPQ